MDKKRTYRVMTSIMIRSDQKDWVIFNHFRLSEFLQEKLDEVIAEQREHEFVKDEVSEK